jgi:hypothetical protein
MLTVSWDSQGVLSAHFLKRGGNVDSAPYCEVLLHHDHATRPHTARATQERIRELQWEFLAHPPYSPKLAYSDFCPFGPLNTAFVADVLLVKRLRQQSKHFYAAVSAHW